MSEAESYPLEQLMLIKKNRFDQAAKTLEQKKSLLEKAYEKLYDVTQERDEVLNHKTFKLNQLRDSLDEGTTSLKIQEKKAYLKVVEERLNEKQKKVDAQQKEVDLAQKQVDIATDELFQRKKDLEKLQMHKVEWEKEIKYWTLQKTALEQDEQGSSTHELKKREQENRNKKRKP